jgi:hypothetical protein
VNFTFNGQKSAELRIGRHQCIIVDAVLQAIGEENLTAIIMIGGYGREEGAYVKLEDGYGPYNDYDYFLVFKGTSKKRAQQLLQKIPDLDHVVGVEVDFYPLLNNKIGKLEYSLMNAEMQLGHQVIWGDESVLQPMQAMPLSQLNLKEFERLLTNRGCLLLMNHIDNEHEHLSKYINKAWLAIGDSLLALAGKYELSYARKKEIVDQVTDDALVIDAYRRAIDIRFRPDLFLPWDREDLNRVSDYWLQILIQVELSVPQQATIKSWPNLFRNLRDRRLRRLNSSLLMHPRTQVTEKLKSLITSKQHSHWQQECDDLLILWGNYS